MKRNSNSAIGALHPLLFFAGVYIVALFFSIFICSSIFYSCNSSADTVAESKNEGSPVVSQKNIAVASVKR
ncbi:MAG TPA: hypothetical protein VI548_10080 [Chitinophagaceae bacterium]|nr:hypothetical protein [Chitinophagaceae bacterium]